MSNEFELTARLPSVDEIRNRLVDLGDDDLVAKGMAHLARFAGSSLNSFGAVGMALQVAVDAFPDGKNYWLRVRSIVEAVIDDEDVKRVALSLIEDLRVAHEGDGE